MAFSDLASNQMVSYTNAQSGGFALNSGQSHVTSNQCMTKSDALAKYNLNASAMVSYTNNQLVPKSAWVSGVVGYLYTIYDGSANPGENATCLLYTSSPGTLYSASSTFVNGMVFYTDTNLTIPYLGSNFAHYSPTYNSLVNISDLGVASNITSCTSSRVQNTDKYSDPCGTIIINLWYDISDDKYYTSNVGSTTYNGLYYVFIGLISPGLYQWDEYSIMSGVSTIVQDVESSCAPN